MTTEEEIKYEKTLEKGINLLKNNPNAVKDIMQVATRLSYLRGRLFEQKDKEELQNAYDIALEENNRLRRELNEISSKTKKKSKIEDCSCQSEYGYKCEVCKK